MIKKIRSFFMQIFCINCRYKKTNEIAKREIKLAKDTVDGMREMLKAMAKRRK